MPPSLPLLCDFTIWPFSLLQVCFCFHYCDIFHTVWSVLHSTLCPGLLIFVDRAYEFQICYCWWLEDGYVICVNLVRSGIPSTSQVQGSHVHQSFDIQRQRSTFNSLQSVVRNEVHKTTRCGGVHSDGISKIQGKERVQECLEIKQSKWGDDRRK